ncbi:MarR family winged helix-turn-helix transcriptional regulator [Streptomyces sp. NPDC001093]|uniref:MarR family winged helix-turn-helix transcriptional regulator n=1 Tax=Streptomyces sp. NPDC001093 TaxID=3154376 RepID=UPI00331C50DB
MAQVELLQVLSAYLPARVSDMGARLCLAQSTVSGLIGRMIAAGLVTRDVDPADHRVSVVALTHAGRERLAVWTAAHERRIDAALAALDDHARVAVEEAPPALFQLAERLGEPAPGGLTETGTHSGL